MFGILLPSESKNHVVCGLMFKNKIEVAAKNCKERVHNVYKTIKSSCLTRNMETM